MLAQKLVWVHSTLIVLLLIGACAAPRDISGQTSPQDTVADPTYYISPRSTQRASAHPRLFFTAEEIDTLRTKSTGSHQEIWRPVQVFAEESVGTSPPDKAPADGSLSQYRDYAHQLIPFALTCVITEQEDVCELATEHLLTYASWSQWDVGGERSLRLAHMLLGNALAYDWLYSRLSDSQRQQVRANLATQAQYMYEASVVPYKDDEWNNWWRDSYAQNHFWVNHSALGIAALALLDEDERASGWLDHAVQKMTRARDVLDGIADGSWHESIPYQSYMLTMSLPFLANLRTITSIDLIPEIYINNYVFWRLYNYLPDTKPFILSYGDFEWNWIGPVSHNLRFAAAETNNGYAEWIAQQYAVRYQRHPGITSSPWYALEFLYYNPDIQPTMPNGLAQARVFDDSESVIWRTGWAENDLVFGLKGGMYGGRFAFERFLNQRYPWDDSCGNNRCSLNVDHDHADANTFYMYNQGTWLAPEHVGVDKRESHFHNTVLIDGAGQYIPPPDNYGVVLEDFRNRNGFLEMSISLPDFDYVASNATRLYRHLGTFEDITRHVVFVRPNYLVMLDNLSAQSPHQYEWISHVGHWPEQEGSWIRGAAKDGQILGIAVAAPDNFIANSGDYGQPYVRVQSEQPAMNMRFLHVLYPTDEAGWESRPQVDTLIDNDIAAGVRVHLADGTVDEIMIAHTNAGRGIEAGSYEHDAEVTVVSRAQDGSLRKLLVVAGDFLYDTVRDVRLVSGLGWTDSFQAVYEEQAVWITTSASAPMKLYAPDVQNVCVNGLQSDYIRSGDWITVDPTDQSAASTCPESSVKVFLPSIFNETSLCPSKCL